MWASKGHSHPRGQGSISRDAEGWPWKPPKEECGRGGGGCRESDQESQGPLKRHSSPGLQWVSDSLVVFSFYFFFFLHECVLHSHTTKLLPPSWQLQSSVLHTAKHGLCLSMDWWLCLASAQAKSTSSAFTAMGGSNCKGGPPTAAGHCFYRDLLPETSHA